MTDVITKPRQEVLNGLRRPEAFALISAALDISEPSVKAIYRTAQGDGTLRTNKARGVNAPKLEEEDVLRLLERTMRHAMRLTGSEQGYRAIGFEEGFTPGNTLRVTHNSSASIRAFRLKMPLHPLDTPTEHTMLWMLAFGSFCPPHKLGHWGAYR